LEYIDSTAELFISVFAGLGVQLRLLSTRTEATASPDPESDYHTIIKDTEKATGELILFTACALNSSHSARSATRQVEFYLTQRVKGPLRLIFFFNFALQCRLLASCGIKILEVSAVAVYNVKAQAQLRHVFLP
jgi:hypothetical protein